MLFVEVMRSGPIDYRGASINKRRVIIVFVSVLELAVSQKRKLQAPKQGKEYFAYLLNATIKEELFDLIDDDSKAKLTWDPPHRSVICSFRKIKLYL